MLTAGDAAGSSQLKTVWLFLSAFDLMTPTVHLCACACESLSFALLEPCVLPLQGQIASYFTCKNPFNYSVKSSLPLVSWCVWGQHGDSESEKEGLRRRKGEREEGRDG